MLIPSTSLKWQCILCCVLRQQIYLSLLNSDWVLKCFRMMLVHAGV